MAVPHQIIGSETEYGISVVGDDEFDAVTTSILLINSHQTPTDIIWDYEEENPYADARGFQVEEQFEVPSHAENVQLNKMLINGARLYVDHAHPEFSTPECSSVLELLTYEKAGERILDLCRRNADALLQGGRTLLIYRNNSDQKGNSYGYHENYLMDRRAPFKLIAEHLSRSSSPGRFSAGPARRWPKTIPPRASSRFRSAPTSSRSKSASTR